MFSILGSEYSKREDSRASPAHHPHIILIPASDKVIVLKSIPDLIGPHFSYTTKRKD